MLIVICLQRQNTARTVILSLISLQLAIICLFLIPHFAISLHNKSLMLNVTQIVFTKSEWLRKMSQPVRCLVVKLRYSCVIDYNRFQYMSVISLHYPMTDIGVKGRQRLGFTFTNQSLADSSSPIIILFVLFTISSIKIIFVTNKHISRASNNLIHIHILSLLKLTLLDTSNVNFCMC